MSGDRFSVDLERSLSNALPAELRLDAPAPGAAEGGCALGGDDPIGALPVDVRQVLAGEHQHSHGDVPITRRCHQRPSRHARG
jgi:hypothetical protein